MKEAKESINEARSDLINQEERFILVKKTLLELMDDVIAENRALHSRLDDLNTYIVDCGAKAQIATSVLASSDDR